jgi:transglutaminase-like putative cysteine protease
VRTSAKLIALLLAVSIPLVGAWLASSIVAYTGGPIWIASIGAALTLVLLPLFWEAWSRSPDGRPRFGLATRLALRTLTLNASLISIALAFAPELTFKALSTRGDWMLDRFGTRADPLRGPLLKTADALEWVYRFAHENPFSRGREIERPTREDPSKHDPEPTRAPSEPRIAQPIFEQHADAIRSWSKADGPVPEAWPMKPILHAAVARMTSDDEVSIESVAQHLRDAEPDPVLRIKALHDWVADRIAYDAPAFSSRVADGAQLPPQDAETVFRTRKAVCAGYANLLAAMGAAAGEEIVVVIGDARWPGRDLSGLGHAWNAAKISGRWHLIDATWDSGYVEGDRFTKAYSTDYFLPPPTAFLIDHFPQDDRWQLNSPAISRSEFLRQPMMSAHFYALGLLMRSPTRSQVDASGSIQLVIDNPRHRFLMARPVPKDRADSPSALLGAPECAVREAAGPSAEVECALKDSGAYRLKLFGSETRSGSYAYLGEIEVNNRL